MRIRGNGLRGNSPRQNVKQGNGPRRNGHTGKCTQSKTFIVRRMKTEMSLCRTLDAADLAVLDLVVRNLVILFYKALSGTD
jgi:hypothetical protein